MKNAQWYPQADLVIRNVKIYTVDLSIEEIKAGKNDFTVIESGYVAAKDGKTISVGEGEPDEALIGSATEVIDGQGKVLVPGLIDCHMHAMFAGMELANVNVKDCKTKAEFLERLSERAKTTPPGAWIRANGMNELLWDVPESPTRADLDSVTTEHPILVGRFCYHRYVVNSMALQLAGITKDTPDPVGGIIEKDSSGECNGVMIENSAMGLIDAVAPAPTEEDRIQAIERIGKVMNSYGLTSCIDCNMTFDQMRAYQQALKQGRLSYRENMMFYTDKAWGDVGYHLKRIEEMVCVTGFGNDMLKLNGVKVTYDGNNSGGTGYMRKPYEHMPETCGYTTISAQELKDIAIQSAKYHWQIGIHTTGDKAADEAIEAIIAAYEAYPEKDLRHYIIHLCTYQDDQVPLLAEHDIPVASQPSIAWLCGEQAICGQEIGEHYMVCGTLQKAGVLVGGSTDCPVVGVSPWDGFYGAITRESIVDGKVYKPEDRISAKDALIMWTKSAAYFSHDEDKLGSVEVGNLADYVLLDRDVLEVPTKDIPGTKVLKTFLGGKAVYSA